MPVAAFFVSWLCILFAAMNLATFSSRLALGSRNALAAANVCNATRSAKALGAS